MGWEKIQSKLEDLHNTQERSYKYEYDFVQILEQIQDQMNIILDDYIKAAKGIEED